MTTSTYPVHVHAHLDQGLSRGLWLVKWLLAIPHYIVLAFLWVAFVVLSVVALFAILFTGRYPRAIFDFNVGVLRWSWRVAYYAYGALGTDRYPPFSLREDPDYPAQLEVDYPEHLSRGLVLVKWWLLAIPHYLVVGLLVSGPVIAIGDSDVERSSGGLIGLLVLVAAVVLLFTGRYPRALFDLVLGLNRWVLRVAGYAALMTDQYPPFRLDQGEDEPGSGRLVMGQTAPTGPPVDTPPGAAAAAPAYSPGAGGEPTRHGWTTGRVVSLVAGSLLLLVALGTGLGGGALAVADQGLRDDDGFLMTPEDTLATTTYAITSTSLEIHTDAPASDFPEAVLGDARVTAVAAGASPLFVGVASTADVDDYLAGVEHATLVDYDEDPVYRTTPGEAPQTPPGDLDIWVAQATGTGEQSVTWPVEDGDWTVVLMNADGTPGVAADVSAGATVPALAWVWGALLGVAVLALLLGLVLVVLPLVGASRDQRPTSQAGSSGSLAGGPQA